MATARTEISSSSDILNAFFHKKISIWDLEATGILKQPPLSLVNSISSLINKWKEKNISPREAMLLGYCINPSDGYNRTVKLDLLKYAAEKGEAAGFTLLAQYYFYNLNLPKNEINIEVIENGSFSGPHENNSHAKKVYHYLRRAIALGDSKAHSYLGTLFLYGWGVKVDIFKAMEHATLGANNMIHKQKIFQL